jgi:predicted small integral membrane protein
MRAIAARAGMRTFKSLLVSLIGLTFLMYAMQNLASIGELRQQIDVVPSAATFGAHPRAFFNSPVASWTGFALITLCQLVIAAVALKGAWDLFAAREGSAEEFKEAKSAAVWAGGLSLLSWFGLSLMIGAGLFRWGSDSGALALTRSFQLASTSALTILFVWGTKD